MRGRGYDVAALAAASLLTLACGTGKGNAADRAPSSSAAPSAPVAVISAPVHVAEEPVTIRATGSFTAAESSKVSPLVSGQVIATPVDVGATVKAGEVIARLDDRDARAKLVQAKATLQQAQATAANAKAQMQRSAGLVSTGDISAVDFETLTTQVETANAQIAQAQAQVTVAQQQVDETVIQAPFRGHVSARPVAAGEYVTTASSIATVVQIQPIKLELQIPEADAAQVNVGMAVSAQVASYPSGDFVGTI